MAIPGVVAAELDLEADPCLGARGSTENSSSTATKSDVEVRLKGAVGLTTPCLTGASRELAVSHSSSTAMLIRACNRTTNGISSRYYTRHKKKS